MFYTQQVELHLMTDEPLLKLRQVLEKLIKEIASQIRYDLHRRDKEYQISQLKLLADHLHTNAALVSPTDYEWLSAVRYYDKSKLVQVQQTDKTYDYGFEPCRPIVTDPSFQLMTTLSYGFHPCSAYYHTTAYILGLPYRTLHHLEDYGFR
jgi:hypothetical protein